MLTHQGVHVNPDKCQAIMETKSPRNMKEAQRLIDRITSLSRFLQKNCREGQANHEPPQENQLSST